MSRLWFDSSIQTNYDKSRGKFCVFLVGLLAGPPKMTVDGNPKDAKPLRKEAKRKQKSSAHVMTQRPIAAESNKDIIAETPKPSCHRSTPVTSISPSYPTKRSPHPTQKARPTTPTPQEVLLAAAAQQTVFEAWINDLH